MKQSEVRKDGQKIYITEYESILELHNHCGAAPINNKSFPSMSSDNGDQYFTKTKDYGEAEMLLKNGWSEGAKKLTHQLKVSMKRDQDEVKRAVYDVVGFQASVPRYLQGIPTNMVNKRTVKQKAKVVTLVKGITYTGSVSAERIMEDSAKFIQIVQEIEKQGIRVNVHVAFHSVRGSEEMFKRIPIKKASERLNISKMSFALMHPSMLRRIIFRAMECELRVRNKWTPGYGQPGSNSEIRSLLGKNEYYIPVLIGEKEAVDILNQIGDSK